MAGTAIDRWSGRHVRALREARRLTIQEFAAKLGVSERMVSKWEAGGDTIHPRPANQSALDTFLGMATEEEQARFNRAVALGGSAQGEFEEPELPGPDRSVRHSADGKLMVPVDAGTFMSGPAGDVPLWLPTFYIDVFPTTNSDYARFLAATGREPPDGWDPSIALCDLRDHPVVFVTWLDAAAYCDWAGKRLPTSAEWEKAARGPRGDIYPWGSRGTLAKVNVREGDLRSTTPVDRYQSGASSYGVFDLCGNVWEWCHDEPSVGRRELKGGAFTSPFARCTPSNFNDASTYMCDDDTGFRTATSGCVAVRPPSARPLTSVDG